MYLIVTTQGEIDIVEGVNNVAPDQSTLHTSASTYPSGGFDVLVLMLPQIVPCHRLGA